MKRLSQKRTLLQAFWLVGALTIASTYNNCAPATFSQSLSSMLEEIKSTALVLINKDAIYTNNDQVEVSLEARLAKEVYITNDPTCNSGGVWEPMVATHNWTLAKKNQEVSVYAKFRNPNEGISTECLHDAIVHDDIKPVVSLQSPSVVTKVNAPMFFFLAADTLSGLEKVTCTWPGKAAEVCNLASSNGNIAEGRYLINVVAQDRAGNIADPVVQDIVVDRTAPTVTLLNVPPVVSNATGVTISFLAQDNLSGVKFTECSWGNNASYSPCTSPVTSVRAEGMHKFFVRATDFAGNVGTETTFEFSIDLTAPTVTITSSPQDFSNSKNGTFTFTGVDGATPITVFECSLDGAGFTSCSTPKTYNGLSEGVHKFEVRGRDSVGNMSAPATRSWVVDTLGPSISFVQTPASPSKNTAADYKYTVSDSGTGVAKTECSIDGSAYQVCAADAKSYAGLAGGNHTFKIKATDKSGNASEASHSFMIDLTIPTIQLTAVPPSPTNLSSFKFEFTANDNIAVHHTECRIDAQAYVNCDGLSQHTLSGLTDGAHRFGVRAVDTAGNYSNEAVHNWTVDVTGPVIAYYQNPPAIALSFTAVSLGFTVTDAISGVKSLQCSLNSNPVPCSSGVIVNLGQLMAGDYTFEIKSQDNAGNSSANSRTFQIRPAVQKSLAATVTENRKVDVLVVIDNSGSMEDEQKNMGSRFSSFLQKLEGLDWQVGVVTTDVEENAVKKDGRLVELAGLPGQYILKPNMPLATAQTIFQNTIQMKANGSGDEQGIKASMRAIQRSQSASAVNVPNAQFFRPGAALTIVIVSDAKESGPTTPEQLIDLVKATWPAGKPLLVHSIVIPETKYTTPNSEVRNPADPCYNYRENANQDGRTYHRLSELTGGVRGTACKEDYSNQLSLMGIVTRDLVSSLTLDCQPIDYNGDGVIDGRDILVQNAGAPVPGANLTGRSVSFASALPVGTNQVTYFCAE